MMGSGEWFERVSLGEEHPKVWKCKHFQVLLFSQKNTIDFSYSLRQGVFPENYSTDVRRVIAKTGADQQP